MKFLEKDLEEIIEETYKNNPKELSERGLNIKGIIKRQLKIGSYGIADLVTFERNFDYESYFYLIKDSKEKEHEASRLYKVPKLIITVYELKKDKIGISAYLQSINYIRGLQKYFEKRDVEYLIDYKIVLIGREIDTSGSFCFIPSFNKNITFYKYSYGIDGLKFDEEAGYYLINENF